jgi:hypothetical protein
MSAPGWVPDPTGDDRSAVALGGGGMLLFLVGALIGSRLLRLLGIGAFLAGGALYGRALMAERNEKIDEASEAARSALDGLDPIARAQVLEDLAHPER